MHSGATKWTTVTILDLNVLTKHCIIGALNYMVYKTIKNKFSLIFANQSIGNVFIFQELMSQMDEHNSTHTLLSAQMKNLNVSWLL